MITGSISAIVFTLFYFEQEVQITTYSGEYRSLMELIYDQLYIEDFGECKGTGRCGTCMVKILHSNNTLSELDRNEEATLKKMSVKDPAVRLSCQIIIDEKLTNSIIALC